jgi:hypothetical protein
VDLYASHPLILSPECHGFLGRIDGDHPFPFPTLLKQIVMNIDNQMANWKIIALVSGNIEAVSGPAAQDRPGTHEWTVWEGPATDKVVLLTVIAAPGILKSNVLE